MEEEIKQDGFPTAAVDHQIRARLKEIIETSERQYKKILDQLPYGILELDVDMNIISGVFT